VAAMILLQRWKIIYYYYYYYHRRHHHHHHHRHPIFLLHSSLTGAHKSMGLNDKTLLIQFSTKNFLTIWHALNITAFCPRIYRAGRRLGSFEHSSNLFGIIPLVDSTCG